MGLIKKKDYPYYDNLRNLLPLQKFHKSPKTSLRRLGSFFLNPTSLFSKGTFSKSVGFDLGWVREDEPNLHDYFYKLICNFFIEKIEFV